MTFNKKRIISTLCAVIMVFAWCVIPSPAHNISAADDADVYALDIEFGSLTFTYDYGVWDVNDMRYEAASTSKNPAEGTVAGYPGWYGFDGTSNKIKITNNSTFGDHSITVSLTYREFNDSEVSSGLSKVTGVQMTLNGTGWNYVSANNFTTTVEAGHSQECLIQLSGEPAVDTGKYSSEFMQPVGMLTLRIDSWN